MAAILTSWRDATGDQSCGRDVGQPTRHKGGARHFVIKVAVMTLAAVGADVSVIVEVIADSATGVPRNTIDLVVKEGLGQLGVQHSVDEG